MLILNFPTPKKLIIQLPASNVWKNANHTIFIQFQKTGKYVRFERFERFFRKLRSKSCFKMSGFLRQLRSKSCFKMSGFSGFGTVYLKKKRSKTAQDLNGFERFI